MTDKASCNSCVSSSFPFSKHLASSVSLFSCFFSCKPFNVRKFLLVTQINELNHIKITILSASLRAKLKCPDLQLKKKEELNTSFCVTTAFDKFIFVFVT